MKDADDQRRRMVRRQIESRGIRDPFVIEAMRRVPREEFVPVALRARAFSDSALPIACDQTISQPFVVAAMIEALQIRPGVRVLEVGTGSGYAAAVLAEIADRVITIERHAKLALEARERLERLGYLRVEVVHGDGSLGWPAGAPYDAILVSAGAPKAPRSLEDQLTEGGRLVLPVGRSPFEQHLVRITREGRDRYRSETLGGVRFVPLYGAEGWSEDDA